MEGAYETLSFIKCVAGLVSGPRLKWQGQRNKDLSLGQWDAYKDTHMAPNPSQLIMNQAVALAAVHGGKHRLPREDGE